VAVAADGSFVVVWQSMDQDGHRNGVYAQRYDAAGSAVGSEFRVNTYTSDHQEAPVVAVAADGSFVVVWQSDQQDGGGRGIYAQRYSTNGLTVGAEFRVNTTTSGGQDMPSAAFATDGSLLIAWASSGGIFAQEYDASGTAHGGEFQVNTSSPGGQAPSVFAASDGGFHVAWRDNDEGYTRHLAGDSLPEVNIYADDPAADEAGGAGRFTVWRDGTEGDLVVSYSVSGTATSGSDYQSLSGTITILNGQRSATISLVALSDVLPEPAETVVLTLTGSTTYEIGALGTAAAAIADRHVNAAPTFTASNQSVDEDSAPHEVLGWASFDPGQPSESAQQPLEYTVTVTGGAGLFSVAPTVDTAGTLRYTLAADASGTATFDVTVRDDGGTAYSGQDTSAPQTFTISVAAVNDAPTLTVPGPLSTIEDQPLSISGVSIADVDAGSGEIRLNLSVAHGTLALSTTGLTFENGTASGDATLEFTGSLTDVNAAIATLVYTPDADWPGAVSSDIDTLMIAVDDLGNTGSGGALTDSATIDITVMAVNDSPQISGPSSWTVLEDVPSSLIGLSLSDPDIGTGSMEVTLEVQTGVLNLPTSGLSFSEGDGTDDTRVVFTGTLSDINAALAALSYTTALDDVSSDILSVTVSDLGGTGTPGTQQSALDVSIAVTPVNDAPGFSLTGDPPTVDEDSVPQTVTGFATGLTPGGGADESTQQLSFEVVSVSNPSLFSVGPAIDANGTLTYTLADDQNGSATVTVQLHDDGGTVDGGVDVSGTQTFTITVNPVNDAPRWPSSPSVPTTRGGDTILDPSSGATDPEGDPITYTLDSAPSKGQLYLNDQVLGVGQTFTDADLVSGALTYGHYASNATSDSFQLTASDGISPGVAVTMNVSVSSGSGTGEPGPTGPGWYHIVDLGPVTKDEAGWNVTNDSLTFSTTSVWANDWEEAVRALVSGTVTVAGNATPPGGGSVPVSYTYDFATSLAFDVGTAAELAAEHVSNGLLSGAGIDPSALLIALEDTFDQPSGYTPSDLDYDDFFAVVRIVKDDLPAVNVTATDPEARELGLDPGQFTFTRNNTEGELTITYTVGGAATPDEDYTSLSGSVTFADGESSVTVDVIPLSDALDEETEDVYVEIQEMTGYRLGPDSYAEVNIRDVPTVSVQTTVWDAREDGEQPGRFRFTRDDSQGELTVLYSVGGKATADVDYVSLQGMITFADEVSEVFLDLNPIDDDLQEAKEDVQLTLDDSTDYHIDATSESAVAYIIDDEAPCPDCPCPTCVEYHFANIQILPGLGDLVMQLAITPIVNFFHRDSANPHPIISATPKIPLGTAAPERVEVTTSFGGLTPQTTWYDISGLNAGDEFRIAALFDATSLATGSYAWQMEVTYHFADSSTIEETLAGYQDIVNRSESEFGNRWMVDGVDRLSITDDRVSIVGNQGVTDRYFVAPESAVIQGSGGPASGSSPDRLGTDYVTGEYTRDGGERDGSTLTRILGGGWRTVTQNGEIREFNSEGLIVKRIDLNGNETIYTYIDANLDGLADEIATISNDFGQSATFSYSNGRLASITDHAGRVSSFLYNTDGTLASITSPDPDGADIDGDGVDQSPIATTFTYDSTTRRMSSVTTSDGVTTETTQFGRDPVTLRVSQIVRPGIDRVEYIDAGLIRGVPDLASGAGTQLNPVAATVASGVVTSWTDETGRTTFYGYDQYDRLIQRINADGHAVTYGRDSSGRITSVTESDPDGTGPLSSLTTQYIYEQDAAGRRNLYQVVLPDGGTITYTNTLFTNSLGVSFYRVTAVTESSHDAPGQDRVTRYEIDSETGNVLSIRQVIGTEAVDATLDADDVYVEISYTTSADGVPAGLIKQLIQYSAAGVSQTSQYTYDAEGKLTREVMGVGTPEETYVEYVYDSVTDNLIGTSVFVAAGVDGLVGTSDDIKRSMGYSFDALDRLVGMTMPERDSQVVGESYRYDAMHRIVSMVDTLGRETKVDYEFNTYQNEQSVTVGGRLVTSTLFDTDGTTILALSQNQHDASDRLVSSTYVADAGADNIIGTADDLLRTTNYTYDTVGRLATVTLPDPDGVGSGLPAPVWQYDYDGRGLVTQITMPDPDGAGSRESQVWSFSYDEMGRLIDEMLLDPTDPQSFLARTLYTYAAGFGDLLSVSEATDASGGLRTTSYNYDQLGRLTSVTLPDPDASNGTTADVPEMSFTYNRLGNLTSQTDPRGAVTEYIYDSLNRLVQIIGADPDGTGSGESPVVNYAYDGTSAVTSMSEVLSYGVNATLGGGDDVIRTTRYEYDTWGQLARLILPDPDGSSGDAADPQLGTPGTEDVPYYVYAYDDAGRLTSVTDALDRTTLYTYDGLDRLASVTLPDPDGAGSLVAPRMEYQYNAASELLSETEIFGLGVNDRRITHYEYDNLGRLTRAILPDADGTPADDANLATAVVDGDRPFTEYTYDLVGNLLSVSDAHGATSQYAYDHQGRLIESLGPDPDGVGTQPAPRMVYDYSFLGELLSAGSLLGSGTDSLWGTSDDVYLTTSYEYDALSRRTASIDALGQRTEYGYDTAGNVTSVTGFLETAPSVFDELVTSYTYDLLGRQTSITDPESGVINFGYDTVGRLTSLTDPVNNTTRWTYDALDRTTSETITIDSTDLSRLYEYDVVSRLTEMTDRRGWVTEYGYDDLDRLTTEQWLDPTDDTTVIETFSYGYDDLGRLVSAGDTVSNVDYTYVFDRLDRLTQETIDHDTTNGPTVVFDTAWDAVFRRTSLAANVNSSADFVNDYQYDDLGRMTQVTQQSQSGGNAVAEKRVDFTYNPLGQFTSVTRYSDVAGLSPVATSEYTFDDLARLVSLEHTTATSATRDYGRQYDSLNRISQYTTPDFTVDYTYDDTSQLVGADYDASGPADETYDYDANGNRIMSGYVTGDHNRLLSDGTYSYTYDEEGNRTTRTNIVTGTVEAYTWDHRNRLVSVVTTDSQAVALQEVEFTYDAFDRRVEKRVDLNADTIWESYERFVYDGQHIALVFDEAGSLTNRYLHGPAIDQILADEQVVNGITDETLWALTDHLGSVRHLVDNTGDVVNDRIYDSFGRLLSESDPSVKHRFGFTGREWDGELGLNYHRARYYDADAAKWISDDPIGFAAGDANLGRYVGNRAESLIDPYGNEHLPASHRGEWISGTPGNGTFRYYDSPYNQDKGLAGKEIRFENGSIPPGGFPPSDYYMGDAGAAGVPIDEVKGTNADFTEADAKMREKLRDPNWRRPRGYTWHHAGGNGCTVMELVDSSVHDGVHHEGSAAEPRAARRAVAQPAPTLTRSERAQNQLRSANGRFVRGLAVLDVYMSLADAVEATGIATRGTVIKSPYYFVEGDSIFGVSKPGWLSSAQKVYIEGPNAGIKVDISNEDFAAYLRQGEEKFGRLSDGFCGFGRTFTPGTHRKSLPVYGPDGAQVGTYDENGYKPFGFLERRMYPTTY
jgi:RHS repeat-associated protein